MPNNKIKFRYGICQNSHVEETGKPCPLCQSKEIQRVIATKDFICSECKEKLKEIPRPPTFWEKYGKVIIGAAIILLLGIVFCIFKFTGNDEPKINGGNQDTTIVNKDTVSKKPKAPVLIQKLSINEGDISLKVGENKQLNVSVVPESHEETLTWSSDNEAVATVDNTGKVAAVKKGTANIMVAANNSSKSASIKVTVAKDKEDPHPTTINLGFGIYEGPIVGGKANGVGGTISFTRAYTIDLKKASGESIEVGCGDKMINVKMKDNRIIQGQLKRKDGSERWIIIG